MKIVHRLEARFLKVPASITPEGPQPFVSGIGCAPVQEHGDTDIAIMVAAPGIGIVSVRLNPAQLDTFALMLADAMDAGSRSSQPVNQVVTIN